MRDTKTNVQKDRHELRETNVVRLLEPTGDHEKRQVAHLPAGRRYKVVFFRLSNTNRPA